MNGKTKTAYKGILFKISGISSAFLIVAILVLAFISIRAIQNSSHEAAVLMGRNKLMGDIASLEDKIAQEYGELSLVNGDLVDSQGNSLRNDFRVLDQIASRLDVRVTIFIREGQDFRRITTSIVDNAGNRAVDTFLGTGSAAYAPVMSGNDYFGAAVILGSDYLAGYRPLFAHNSREVIGILFIGVEMSSIDLFIAQNTNKQITTIVMVAVIILLIATLSNVMSSRIMLLKPIKGVMNILKDISEGEGDLTMNISVKSKDEIGGLAYYFNMTIEKIKNLVIEIKKETNSLSRVGEDLSNDMTETAASINQIAANIQSIKTQMINQSASVSETNATMEQITANINKLNGHVEKQADSVAQSSSAIEQMLANIQSVTQTLVKNTENVNELTTASETGRSGLQDVATDIQEIARESEGLLEINAVMENIASQTNLLSMNAAIEAAHAGEAGKGFAVVADEIRKLAENSSEQSKTISSVLKKIKGSIDKITQSTDSVLKRFEAIDSGVRIVAEQEENIRNAMEEQGHGSKQILDSVSLVNETTQLVRGVSLEMLEGAKEVIREAGNLEKTTQEITGGVNEMATGAEHVNSAVNHVNNLSNKNQEHIGLLTREVSRFKVE